MNIRNRIFFFFILIIGLAMFGFTRWLSDDLKSRYNEAIEEPLVDVAHILAESIGSQLMRGDLDRGQLQRLFDRVYAREFSAQIFRLEKKHVDMFVYVTDRDGRVLFHSADASLIGKRVMIDGWLPKRVRNLLVTAVERHLDAQNLTGFY